MHDEPSWPVDAVPPRHRARFDQLPPTVGLEFWRGVVLACSLMTSIWLCILGLWRALPGAP